MKMLLITLFSLVTLSVFAAHDQVKVIYGEDNRVDVFASTQPEFVKWSRSTAAMIESSSLRAAGQQIDILAPSMTDRGFCSSERFSKQSTAAMCSGFLVGTKYLVTAGHCIRSESDCASYKWVFDYKTKSDDQKLVSVSKNAVYSCKKIISRSLDEATDDDYAMIELDRSVTDREPLKVRTTGRISVGEELVVIGHPTGLPTKISDGANVRALKGTYFVANLDTYGGNSGSAVFNVRTGEVEGILVRGEQDYNYDYNQGCRVSNICQNDGCRGEDVTYITNIKELLQSL
jgi:V8-like Glu-specific endopeptidase